MKEQTSTLLFKIIFSVILVAVLGYAIFYFALPAFNLRSPGFYLYVSVLAIVGALPFLGFRINHQKNKVKKGKKNYYQSSYNVDFNKWTLLALIPLVILLLGLLFSSTLFCAKDYANVIEVKESDFATDLPETTEITNIALMDTASATILGNRTLGSLSDVVSQYTLNDYYTQINYQGSPKKVTTLEYDGFFKWAINNSKGIPGMVMVDPVKSSAEYVKFDEPIFYTESGYFGDDLTRKLRFEYPTKIFESISFEIDDNGQPFYIVSCAKPKVSLFGAMDINEVIIFNPVNGESEIYSLENTPSWIDIVYTGDLACKKYNWHGTLSGGFFNSVIGNVGCKHSTDDYGYVVIGDDVWYFTGVTSAVSNDKSNIGFLLTNARTGEYKFYSVIGAEEHSAMDAAEGEVQEKGYVASFPSLVNISGQATYIMVLKDDAGLVKLYALVNVENYSIVATGTTQADAMSAYKKLLKQNNIDIGADTSVDITVENVRIALVSGVSTVYITATDGKVYKGYLEADESLILIRNGDSINISYTESDKKDIYIISSWKFN
ncbi:MAG: hypothetical protein IKA02_05160 [Clostridia bacterium]|nr:hypothetical protein [Clostridia bacterium]